MFEFFRNLASFSPPPSGSRDSGRGVNVRSLERLTGPIQWSAEVGIDGRL